MNGDGRWVRCILLLRSNALLDAPLPLLLAVWQIIVFDLMILLIAVSFLCHIYAKTVNFCNDYYLGWSIDSNKEAIPLRSISKIRSGGLEGELANDHSSINSKDIGYF